MSFGGADQTDVKVSVFLHGINETSALLGLLLGVDWYIFTDVSATTFGSHLQGPSSPIFALKIETIVCSETSSTQKREDNRGKSLK
jgi:hypothetical protein